MIFLLCLGCFEYADEALIDAVAPKTRAFLSIRLKDKRWRSDKTSFPRDSTNDFKGRACPCFLGFLDEEGVETEWNDKIWVVKYTV